MCLQKGCTGTACRVQAGPPGRASRKTKPTTKAPKKGIAEYPIPNLRLIEDRFWFWVHHAMAKIARGEFFEALEGLTFLRRTVLGPLALIRSGARPAGVRNVERLALQYVRDLQSTVAGHNAIDCLRALRASVELYCSFQTNVAAMTFSEAAESATMHYLSEVEQRDGLIHGLTWRTYFSSMLKRMPRCLGHFRISLSTSSQSSAYHLRFYIERFGVRNSLCFVNPFRPS